MRMTNKTKRLINYHRHKEKLKKATLNQAKKEKSVVYGARSIEAQVPGIFFRNTQDYDILSKKPKKSARVTKNNYNKIVSSNQFYTKQAMHKGTYKVMDKGMDFRKGTRDDFGVVDYTSIPKPAPRIKIINGVRYRALSQEKKAKQKALKDKLFKFRHEKDRADYNSIVRYKRFKRKKK